MRHRCCRADATEVAGIEDAAPAGLPDPDDGIEAARALQLELAAKVRLRDGYSTPLRTVAAFNVDYEDGGATARAVAVLFDADSLQKLGSEIARAPVPITRIPGLLSFRGLPALLQALEALPQAPDLAFVAGHGIAHPRGLGLAAHFGVASGVPSIGVANEILVGSGSEPHQVRGAYTPLRSQGKQVGWLLRSRLACDPLVVSPGHRMSMASTADLVMRFTRDDRLPEPMRLAELLGPPRDGEAEGDD